MHFLYRQLPKISFVDCSASLPHPTRLRQVLFRGSIAGMGLENKPAHVCEKLSLPQLPDKYWWKIKQNSFWDVPEVHLMWKGWFFSYSQNYYVGITLVHEKGYSAKEAAEIMAEHLWEDFQKEQNIANSTSELWAK